MRSTRLLMGLTLTVVVNVAWAEGFVLWFKQMQSISGALSVVTKQEAISSDKGVVAHYQASLGQSQADAEIQNIEQVRQIYAEYGPSGQMVDPCYQMSMASSVVNAKSKTDDAAMHAASLVYSTGSSGQVGAGGIAGVFGATKQITGAPYAASVVDRVNRHLTRYCSVAESAAGYCNLNANGMQAGDSDFSLHLQPGKTYGWDQTEAATDFVKTVAPVATISANTTCSSIECLSARSAARKQEVSLSMSRFSMMQFVEAHSTQMTGTAKTLASPQ